jgi:quinol-cytochrome oxidoreductase complex cytochrome b subunit
MPAVPPLPPSVPREVPPAAYSVGPGPGWTQRGAPYTPQGSAIQWDLAWKGVLLAGVGAAILTAIPFVKTGCCLWMLGAGVLSVSMYRKRVPGTLITPGMGMKLGALAGAFGFMVNAVLTVRSFVVVFSSADFRRAMQEQMEKQMAKNPDPKAQAMVQHFMDWMSSPQGAATFVVLMLIVLGVVFIAITAAGGALGASMSGRRREFR